AVDLGKKRIGLAITDPLNIIAQPFQTIEFKGKKRLAETLTALIAEKTIGTIVFGVPVTLSGNESQKTKEILKLIDELKQLLPDTVVIDTIDESLTTVEAHSILHQMGKKPSKHKDRVDQIAAQRILQSYMGH
ncbi:MAG: Holliday junction resolvase RuvX, partial [Calditrichaeota bacterium]|nr:Holliday junction resolvase RuvX [Calditrichota bacterium]